MPLGGDHVLLGDGWEVPRQDSSMAPGSRPASSAASRITPRRSIEQVAIEAEGLETVSQPPGPAGRRIAVPTDVDGHPALHRLGKGMGVVEGDELAVELGPFRSGVGPQCPHGDDGLVRAAPPAPRVGTGGPHLLLHPSDAQAHADPATREHVDGGDPLGQTTGWWFGATSTPVASVMRSVTAAR